MSTELQNYSHIQWQEHLFSCSGIYRETVIQLISYPQVGGFASGWKLQVCSIISGSQAERIAATRATSFLWWITRAQRSRPICTSTLQASAPITSAHLPKQVTWLSSTSVYHSTQQWGKNIFRTIIQTITLGLTNSRISVLIHCPTMPLYYSKTVPL